MQQRYYDPVAGRFLSVDPVVTDAKTGSSFNRYAYASNSPYKYIDPDGRNPVAVLGVGVKVTDAALLGIEVYAAAQSGGATAVGTVLLENAVLSTIPGGKTFKHLVPDAKIFRRGPNDTKKLLTDQAKAAEEKVGIHGVSVSTSPKPNPKNPTQQVRETTVDKLDEAGVKLHKTFSDPDHYTAEIPNPVTSEFVKMWNEIFK
jgi:uncharacterized protein RhaS with RHS repeats